MQLIRIIVISLYLASFTIIFPFIFYLLFKRVLNHLRCRISLDSSIEEKEKTEEKSINTEMLIYNTQDYIPSVNSGYVKLSESIAKRKKEMSKKRC